MSSQDVAYEGEGYSKIREMIAESGKRKFGGDGYRRLVFTNGCFDILHPGHVRLLSECRKLAGPKGAVVVGVNSDNSVSRIKGSDRPINDELFRCTLLINMKHVDHVVTFDEDTPEQLITHIRPDMIVKGSDYEHKKVVGSDISTVVFVKIEDDHSTTGIIERIRRGKK